MSDPSKCPECKAPTLLFDGEGRDPIDRTSAMMFAKGVASPVVTIACDHWEICPPLKKQVRYGDDLTGRRQGRMVVVGMYRDRKGRWVVRCDCGSFEIRTAKAICNAGNNSDKCVKCRKTDQAKRHHEFAVRCRKLPR